MCWSTRRRARRSAALALAALLLAGCGAAAGGGDEPPRDALRGLVLPRPLEKPDFTLSDTDGRPFDFRAETDGYLTLLFFGFTHCPDVCPVHMANLAAVIGRLPRQTQSRIKVVFVSVDPARDTAERIRAWLDAFDTRFIGLRGPRERVDSVMTALQLPTSIIEEPDSTGEYGVGHASQVVAFTPDGLARAYYPFGMRQADWAYDLPRLVEFEPTVRVTRAYVAEPPTSDRAALYLTIENRSEEDDALLDVSTAAAARAEIHRSSTDGGRARMEPVDTVPVPGGGRVRLGPGGYHVMLLELAGTPAAGDSIATRLVFRHGGAVTVRAEVRPYAELEALLGPGDGDAAPEGS